MCNNKGRSSQFPFFFCITRIRPHCEVLFHLLIHTNYALLCCRCKRTFQGIEHGFTLDALTDLTGAICEFFTPDLDPPPNLFHILYKSSQCRSFMACWRNNKRLTPAAFNSPDGQEVIDCPFINILKQA
ncbi:calpain-3-like [Elysia marginata]|uniref:Calpain-3-like n=1 Tax=Elysia marginata TaxID=1093978 RepID=A0AAV4GE85_9GAST|nr:calpain-3-like [Elysia marginata]